MCIVWHSLLDTSVLGSLWQCASGIFVYVYVCVCYRNYFHDSNVSNDNMKSTVVIKQQKIITGIFSSPWFYSVL